MTDARLELGADGADLVLDGDDLARDEGLQTSVFVSLLSDGRADPGSSPIPAELNPRGWWADTIRDRFGSRLWTLEREKRTQETLERARELATEALAWLLEDQIASSVDVQVAYDEFGRLVLEIQIARGTSRRFASLWAGTTAVHVTVGQTAVLTAPVEPPPPPPPPPPIPDQSVVVILFDDGGAEWFDWSGLLEPHAGFANVPRIQEMRARGVTFLRGYATSICAPTRACFQTARQGFRNSLAANLDGPASHGYGLGDYAGIQTELLIARALRLGRDGTADQTLGANAFTYASGWFGKGHLFSDSGEELYPVSHGWGRYVGCPPNAESLENWPIGALDPLNPGDPGYVTPHPNSGHFHFRENTTSFGATVTVETYGAAGTWPAGGPYVAWDPTQSPRAAWDAFKVTRDAISWINSRSQPFLALLCLNPPHAPFETPPYTYPDTVGVGASGETRNLISPATQAVMSSLNGGAGGPGFVPTDPNRLRQVYRANIEAIDTLIGLLWDRMDPAKRDRTVFIFTGDNGTVAEAVDTPYSGTHAKRTIFEQGLRVPFLVWGSSDVIAEPGRNVDHLVHTVDIMPTVLEITGCDPERWNPGGAIKIDGRSFAPILRNPEASPARSFVYNEIFLPIGGKIDGDPSGTPPIPLINENQWIRCYSDGVFKVIQNAPASVPPYRFFRIGNELQPGSGMPGYLELPDDDLYPIVVAGTDPVLSAKFAQLLEAMRELIAS